MMADRGYVQTCMSNNNDPPTLATQIISQHLESDNSDGMHRVAPDRHSRNQDRRGTRGTGIATTLNTTTTGEPPPQAPPHPANNPQDPTPPPPPVDLWANLAGDARMTGEAGGSPQCSLAAARNASRNGSLTINQFGRWCEGGDIQIPHWCEFLTDCCAEANEVAIPVDRETARTSGGHRSE
jgi:hypothetical protein